MNQETLSNAWIHIDQCLNTEMIVETTYNLREKGLALSGNIIKGHI